VKIDWIWVIKEEARRTDRAGIGSQWDTRVTGGDTQKGGCMNKSLN